jgi:hypothetical protein
MDEFALAVAEFIWSVEEVFDRDWEYTERMFQVVGEGGTFLQPNVDDEGEDWGNRAFFLERYRNLRRVMQERRIDPIRHFDMR